MYIFCYMYYLPHRLVNYSVDVYYCYNPCYCNSKRLPTIVNYYAAANKYF